MKGTNTPTQGVPITEMKTRANGNQLLLSIIECFEYHPSKAGTRSEQMKAIEQLRNISIFNEITNEQLGHLFGVSGEAFREHVCRQKRGSLDNGRPSFLTEEMKSFIIKTINQRVEQSFAVTIPFLKREIYNVFHKSVTSASISYFIKNEGYEIRTAKPDDAKRWNVDGGYILSYYNNLGDIIRGVRMCLIFNVDESNCNDMDMSKDFPIYEQSSDDNIESMEEDCYYDDNSMSGSQDTAQQTRTSDSITFQNASKRYVDYVYNIVSSFQQSTTIKNCYSAFEAAGITFRYDSVVKDYFAYVDIRKTKVSEAYNCLSLDKQIKSFHKVVDEIDSLRKRRRLRVSELPRLRYYEQVNENSESPEEMEEKEELEKKNWKKRKKVCLLSIQQN